MNKDKIDLNKNYYDILSVDKDSDAKEIKKAYFKLSKVYHPDKTTGNVDVFERILEAYKVLIDDELRKWYDDNSEWGAHFDIESLKYQLDSWGESKSFQKQWENVKQNSLNIIIEIDDFEDETIIDWERHISCKACDGTGVDLDQDLDECEMCEGTAIWDNKPCKMCKGLGKISSNIVQKSKPCVCSDGCPKCNYSGDIFYYDIEEVKTCSKCDGTKQQIQSKSKKIFKKDFEENLYKIEYGGNSSKFYMGKIGDLWIKILD